MISTWILVFIALTSLRLLLGNWSLVLMKSQIFMLGDEAFDFYRSWWIKRNYFVRRKKLLLQSLPKVAPLWDLIACFGIMNGDILVQAPKLSDFFDMKSRMNTNKHRINNKWHKPNIHKKFANMINGIFRKKSQVVRKFSEKLQECVQEVVIWRMLRL